MISMQRTLGQPVMVPPGNMARKICTGDHRIELQPADVGHDMVHVRVALDRHVLVDPAPSRPRTRGRDRCARDR